MAWSLPAIEREQKKMKKVLATSTQLVLYWPKLSRDRKIKNQVNSMKMKQKPIGRQTVAALIGGLIIAGSVASVNAQTFPPSTPIPVNVTDVTDWGTTPVEVVYATSPYLGLNDEGVYAGINTLLVTGGSTDNGTYGGFCIDPFHWSATGLTHGYDIVTLTNAPKPPGELNAYTAKEIEELWGDYYSPSMTSVSAASLQIAIWELVSSNAYAHGQITAAQEVTFQSSTFNASADLASLANYSGPIATLEGLTGPGQDYVIDIPNANVPPPSAPDGGATLIMLALSLGALVMARPAFIKSPGQLR